MSRAGQSVSVTFTFKNADIIVLGDLRPCLYIHIYTHFIYEKISSAVEVHKLNDIL